MINGTARRRQQTITHDALGRAVRADEMNWDGTIYRTLRTTYNARDQVTEVRQEGTSGAARVSTIGYDGHGRVASEQRPEQTQVTSYLYNADDTLQQVTDARGATTNFLYNARHLVTQVSYTTPNATVIPNTPTVDYTYDAAGNRISMADGLGSVSYLYDSLSRLTSETRQFTGVPRSHQLSYQYNLAGGLTRITDPDGAQVDYQHDRVGRVTSVTGAGTGSAPVYVASVQYRAWGAMKRVAHGNGLHETLTYTARLQPASYELIGSAQYGSPTVMRVTYIYHPDGRLRFSDDTVDDRFDRAYSFDHVGRVVRALTGGEARNSYFNQTGGTSDGPYRQTYTHDEWDNLTSQATRMWTQLDVFTASFDGRNRHPQWVYDAAGNLTQDATRSYRWDAAGRMVESAEVAMPVRQVEHRFDGDGRRAKRVSRDEFFVETSFEVVSAVQGGGRVVEVDAAGNRRTGYVMGAGGQTVARLEASGVVWVHGEAAGHSRAESRVSGSGERASEHDPMGISVGLEDATIYVGEMEREVPSLLVGADGEWSGLCLLDGIATDCALVDRVIAAGAAAPCPNNDCGPRPVYSQSQGRYVGFGFLGFTGSGLSFSTRVWIEGSGLPLNPNKIQHDDPNDETVRIWSDVRGGYWKPLSFAVGGVNPFPFAGFAGMRKPVQDQSSPLTNDERSIVNRVANLALKMLAQSEDCLNFIRGTNRNDSPISVLATVNANNRYERLPALGSVAAQAAIGAGNRGPIAFRPLFFQANFNEGIMNHIGATVLGVTRISLNEARAIVLLHELKHLMRGTHDSFEYESLLWDRLIYTYCVRGGRPTGNTTTP